MYNTYFKEVLNIKQFIIFAMTLLYLVYILTMFNTPIVHYIDSFNFHSLKSQTKLFYKLAPRTEFFSICLCTYVMVSIFKLLLHSKNSTLYFHLLFQIIILQNSAMQTQQTYKYVIVYRKNGNNLTFIDNVCLLSRRLTEPNIINR